MKVLKKTGRVMLLFLAVIVAILLIALLFLEFYPGVGKYPSKAMREEYEENSDAFQDGKFRNLGDAEDSVYWSEFSKMSDATEPTDPLPVTKVKPTDRAEKDDLNYTWLAHSSSFIQLGDQNILIDPVLTTYASPVSFIGSKRFSEIPMSPGDVPEIDVLFISHDHYDHMDYQTIMEINDKVSHYIVPLGVDTYLKGWDIDENKIHALDWYDSVVINGVTYTLTPGQHFSGRNPLRSNVTLWGGLYFYNDAYRVYYTGDGGFNEEIFKGVYETFGACDLMLCECGQYDPGWPEVHMFPEESAKAAAIMHAKWCSPVHWGAFVLSRHSWKDPAERFSAEAEELGLNGVYPTIGQTVNYADRSEYNEYWWDKLN